MQVVLMEDVRASGEQAWALSNTALKSIRDTHENPPGFPITDAVDLFEHDPFPIKTLHRTTGMRYELTEPEQPWSWRRMLNGMRLETLARVVGPGIIGICCKPIHGSYDQARRHAAKVF